MIFGVGCDICQIKRIDRVYKKHGQRFVNRLLAPEEQRTPISSAFLAKRFAGKEAVIKAMGTAFTKGLFLKDVRITNALSGQPIVTLTDKAQAYLPPHVKVHLSLSDEEDYALAYAVIEVRDKNI